MVESGRESPQGPETLPSTCNTLFYNKVFLENIEMVNAKMQFREWKGPQGKARAPMVFVDVICNISIRPFTETLRSFVWIYLKSPILYERVFPVHISS